MRIFPIYAEHSFCLVDWPSYNRGVSLTLLHRHGDHRERDIDNVCVCWLSFGMLQHTGDPLDDMITPQRTHLSAASAPQMGQLGDASPSLTTTYHPLTTYYRPVYHLFFLQLTILTSHSCFNHFVQFCLDWDLFAFKSWIWSWCLWSSRKRVESDHCGNGDCSRAWYFLISHIGYYKGA